MQSFVGTAMRRTEIHGDRVRESYPVTYAVADEPVAKRKRSRVAEMRDDEIEALKGAVCAERDAAGDDRGERA